MKRVIFLSKSKLAANLLQFLLHDTNIDCLCLQDHKDLKPKIFSQKKLLIIIDDSFSPSIANAKLTSAQKIIFLTDAKIPKVPPCPVTEILRKPFLADELIKCIEKNLGGKA